MLGKLALAVLCLVSLFVYYFQYKNENPPCDNENFPPNSNRSSCNNERKRKVFICGAILLILSIIGPDIVDDCRTLEENLEKAYSGTAEKGENIPQEIKLAAVSIKKRIFEMEMNLEKLLKKVPDVKGLTQDAAGERLEAEGISWYVGDSIYSEKEAGKILSQNPEAGAVVDENTKVVLVVSKGVEPVEMPDVLNQLEEKAKSDLEELGLKVTKKEEYSDKIPEGNVISQSENAGKSVPPGTEVEIVISKGKKPEENGSEQTATARTYTSSDTDSPSQGTQGGQPEQNQETEREGQLPDTAGETQPPESNEESESGETDGLMRDKIHNSEEDKLPTDQLHEKKN